MAEKINLAIHKGEDAEIELGGLRFRACRREIDEVDGGVTLQVMGPVGAEETELLRFDCFRKAPHYHAPGENPKETKIDAKEFGDGRDWVYEQLSKNPGRLLAEAGFESLPSSPPVDLEALSELGPRLRTLVKGLPEPSETSYFEIDAALLGKTPG